MHIPDAERKHAPHVLREAWVEPLRHLRLPRRLQTDPNRVVVERRDAHGTRSRDLALEIARQAVAAHPHDVLRAPAGRPVAEQLEFIGRPLRVLPEVVDVGVNAGGRTLS